MKKIAPRLIGATLSGLLALPFAATVATAQTPAPAAPAAAPAPENTLVPKVSLYSEYEYRGIAQTAQKPAVQFNLDYTHTSGFYLGTFVTNIKWLKEAAKAGG
ncbi:MAG: TorF family putative porin, partial [Usitatibacteraceae bacterium]